ncbi:T-cell receptor alpha chain V region CTL-L17 [Cricetulus griseus]|nr:T-cell receptor alpha chain V region CTL-L17 [Cricetulus griseus]
MKRLLCSLLGLLCSQVCWLSQGEQVEQLPSNLRVQEGDSAIINCTYTDSTLSYFLWYKQGPGEHPKLIIDIRSTMERKQDQRLIVLQDKKAKHFSLHITDTQPGDSAMYFCAASAHCSPDTCSLSSNLPQGLEPHPHPVSQAFQRSICQLLVVKCQL